jgi:hypothetical protein
MALQGNGKRSPAYIAAAIIVAGVLVSATLILVPLSHSPTTITEVSVTTSTETMTSTSTSVTISTETTNSTSVTTDYIPINDSGDSALLADCVPTELYGFPANGALVAGPSSPAIICVRVYWFNSTAPFVLNTTSLLQIGGYAQAGAGQPFDGGMNFTVTASVDQLLLGGSTNANEGTILAFAITAKPGASGTYQLAVAQSPRGFQLGSGQPYYCGPNGDLVAGTGQPDYVPSSITRLCSDVVTSGTNSFSIPGVGPDCEHENGCEQQVPAGVLFYKIISVTNSTQ